MEAWEHQALMTDVAGKVWSLPHISLLLCLACTVVDLVCSMVYGYTKYYLHPSKGMTHVTIPSYSNIETGT